MSYKFNFKCSNCDAVMELQSEWIGIDMRCPQCNTVFTVQSPEQKPSTTSPTLDIQAVNDRKARVNRLADALHAATPAPTVRYRTIIEPVADADDSAKSAPESAEKLPEKQEEEKASGDSEVKYTFEYISDQDIGDIDCEDETDNAKPASLILGILSFFFMFCPLGILLAVIGVSIGYKKHYKPGVIIGTIGLTMSIIASLISTLFVLSHISAGNERARQVQCSNQLKKLGYAMIFYSCDNHNYMPCATSTDSIDLPLKGGYMECSSDDEFAQKIFKNRFMTCPSSKQYYVYIGEGINANRDNPNLPILLEQPNSHSDGIINVFFLDGSTQRITLPSDLKSVNQIAQYLLDNAEIYCNVDNCSDENKCATCKVLINAAKCDY